MPPAPPSSRSPTTPNVAALARRHYRLDRGVLTPVDVNRVLALAEPEVAL